MLADGTLASFAELPDGLGGRALAVDDATGQVAVFASSDATSKPWDPPGVDRLAVFDSSGGLLAVGATPSRWPGLAGPRRAGWTAIASSPSGT